MRLRILTPLAVVVDEERVSAIRAEDATGVFGILRGHEDFLTTLPVSVVSWRPAEGGMRHCAVRGGVLTVTEGDLVAVATREAVVGTDLERLHRDVLARLAADREAERSERFESTRLHLAAIREITRHLAEARRREGP
jgi:F-type H+-transporting ATPase subunit epsilon